MTVEAEIIDEFPEEIRDSEALTAEVIDEFSEGLNIEADGPKPKLTWKRAGGAVKAGTEDVVRNTGVGITALQEASLRAKKIKENERGPSWFAQSQMSIREKDEWIRRMDEESGEGSQAPSLEKQKELRVDVRTEAQEADLEKRKTQREWFEKKFATDPEYFNSSGFWEDVIRMGPQMVAQMGTFAATGGTGSTLFMGSQILGASYQENVANGVSPDRAVHAGLANAIMQAPMEQLGISKLGKFWKTKGKAMAKLKELGLAMGTEWLTETLQSQPDLLTAIWAQNPDASQVELLKKFAAESPEALGQGAYEGLTVLPYTLVGGGKGLVSAASKDLQIRKLPPEQQQAIQEVQENPTISEQETEAYEDAVLSGKEVPAPEGKTTQQNTPKSFDEAFDEPDIQVGTSSGLNAGATPAQESEAKQKSALAAKQAAAHKIAKQHSDNAEQEALRFNQIQQKLQREKQKAKAQSDFVAQQQKQQQDFMATIGTTENLMTNTPGVLKEVADISPDSKGAVSAIQKLHKALTIGVTSHSQLKSLVYDMNVEVGTLGQSKTSGDVEGKQVRDGQSNFKLQGIANGLTPIAQQYAQNLQKQAWQKDLQKSKNKEATQKYQDRIKLDKKLDRKQSGMDRFLEKQTAKKNVLKNKSRVAEIKKAQAGRYKTKERPAAQEPISFQEVYETFGKDKDVTMASVKEGKGPAAPDVQQAWKEVAEKTLKPHATQLKLRGYNVHVVQSHKDLPAYLAKEKDAKNGLGVFDTVTGKDIYVMSGNHKGDTIELKRTLWHEVGHHAVRKVYGKEFNQLMKNADQYYKTNGDLVAAEEKLIGDFLQNKKVGVVKWLTDLIKKVARKLGFGSQELTDSDIADVVKKMRENALEGKHEAKSKAPVEKTGRFSKPQQSNYKEHIGPKAVKKDKSYLSWIEKRIQNYLDSQLALKKLEAGMSKISDLSGYKSYNLMSNFSRVFTSFLEHGSPVYQDNWISMDVNQKGIQDIVRDLKDQTEDFFNWITLQSAKELKKKKGSNVNLFGKDVDDAQFMQEMEADLNPKYEANRKSWEKHRKRLREINKSVLDFAQTAGMINQDTRKDWERRDYIPFFRVDEAAFSHDLEGVLPTAAMPTQLIQQLKGSNKNIGDPIANLIGGYQYILYESLHNIAKKKSLALALGTDLLQKLPGKPPKISNVIAIRHKGKVQYFEVSKDATDLYDALVSLDVDTKGFGSSSIMKMLNGAKRLLTWAVTQAPGFRMANWVRDTFQAGAVGNGFIPVVDSVIGGYHALLNTKEFKEFAASGGAFSGAYHERDMKAKTFETTQKLKKKLQGETNTFMKLYNSWKFIGEVSENSARMGMYLAAKRKGKTNFEAAYEAKDLLDFHRTGRSPVLSLLIRTIPFMNARLQGLYKLGRAGKSENTKQFALAAGTTMIASLALHWANSEDEWYKNIPDYQKKMYWHINENFKIPIPFEFGSAFGVLPVALKERWDGDRDNKEFAKFIGMILKDTFALDPTGIQLIKPARDWWMNYDSFRGQPIIPQYKQDLEPQLQYDKRTSKTTRLLSEYLPLPAKKMDKLLRDYFGFAADVTLAMTDVAAAHIGKFPDDPEGVQSDLALHLLGVSRFYTRKGKEHSFTRNQEKFYHMLHAYDRALKTYNAYKKKGDKQKAKQYRKDHKKEIRLGKKLGKFRMELSRVNTEIAIARESRKLSKAEKREKIDRLLAKRERVFNKAIKKVKRTQTEK